jgi:hypothetical protein
VLLYCRGFINFISGWDRDGEKSSKEVFPTGTG